MSPYPWLAPFPEPFQDAVLAALARPGGRPLACFDADGTLWTEDVGEAFLRMLLAGPLEPLVRENPHLYADYEERVRRDIVDGYGWAVQLMAGLSETDVVGWAQELAAAELPARDDGPLARARGGRGRGMDRVGHQRVDGSGHG
jgi:hypothetical protein